MADARAIYYCTPYHVSQLYRPGRFQSAITLAGDSGASQTNKNRIFVSAANSLPFVPGDTVMVWDSDAPWGETAIVQSITSSGATPYLETTASMTGNYTTAKTARVKLLSYFTSMRTGNATGTITTVTKPTSEEICQYINEAEAYIETRTRTAFRVKTVTEESHQWPLYPYRPADWLDGIPLPLNYRMIRTASCADGSYTLDTASGDKFEVYDGNSWVDYLTAYGSGRNQTLAIDPVRGVAFMRQYYKLKVRLVIRITYRYGYTTVPADITQACALLVAARLYDVEDSIAAVPGGGDLNVVGVETKAKKYKELADEILSKYREPVLVWM